MSKSLASSSRMAESASPENPTDRRRHVRVEGPFDGCRRGVIDVPVMIHNLSEGGCFVDSRLDAEPGQQLTLGVRSPGEDWITVKAEVVHSQLGVGFAVRFLDVPGATRSGLERIVAARSVGYLKN
jgi:hypothetical protein